jgi:hypothetical protein
VFGYGNVVGGGVLGLDGKGVGDGGRISAIPTVSFKKYSKKLTCS